MPHLILRACKIHKFSVIDTKPDKKYDSIDKRNDSLVQLNEIMSS